MFEIHGLGGEARVGLETGGQRVKGRGERGKKSRRSRIRGEIREGFKRRERSSDFRGKR